MIVAPNAGGANKRVKEDVVVNISDDNAYDTAEIDLSKWEPRVNNM